MFGRVLKKMVVLLSTRPNIIESHSEISTQVPLCTAKTGQECFEEHGVGPLGGARPESVLPVQPQGAHLGDGRQEDRLLGR